MATFPGSFNQERPRLNPNKEMPSTYFVQDRSNQEETTRLKLQDQLITTAMGGVLPEQPDTTRFRRVLDVGCGTGGWLIEMAQTCPNCIQLVGIDVSKRMVEYAREQARAAQQERVEFHVMDALLLLSFPSNYFDLVNLRFGSSFLRTWEWSKILMEMLRVCHPYGIVRLTEPAIPTQSGSPMYLLLCRLLHGALLSAGHYFEDTPTSITDRLAALLHQYGGRCTQSKAHQFTFRAGTSEGQACIDDIRYAFRTLRPFLAKWGYAPTEYDKIYQHACEELEEADFSATWDFLTAWAVK